MLKYLGVALISVLMGIGFGLLIAERRQRNEARQWKNDPDMLEADADFQERLKHDRRLREIYHTNKALYHDE
jgi:hypothetical protein